MTDYYIERMDIKPRNRDCEVFRMSGGNQQKVLIAKYLSCRPDILLMDEPTKGIDVIAKVEILSLIKELSAAGKGILVVSSELPDLFEACDRILILKEGKVTGELEKREFDEAEILTKVIT